MICQDCEADVVCTMRRTSRIVFRIQDEIQMWKQVAKRLPPPLQIVVGDLMDAEENKFQEFDSYRTITYAARQTCRNQENYLDQYAVVKDLQGAIKRLKVVAKELPPALQLLLNRLEEFEDQAFERYLSSCSRCTCCN